MIATLILAATLAAVPASSSAASTTLSENPSLSEKVTLELKDASLKDLLEKVAVLLDATPIFEPGIDGTVTISVKEMPIRDFLSKLQKDFDIKIALQVSSHKEPGKPEEHQRRLVVTRREGTPPPSGDAAALDRELLGDATLPRHPKSETTAGEQSDLFEFRASGGAVSAWHLRPALSRVELPGCTEPVRVAVLSTSDGGRLVFPGAEHPRIERPGRADRKETSRPVRLPGCGETFTITQRDQDAGPEARIAQGDPHAPDQWMVGAPLLEVSQEHEKVVSGARVQTITGGVYSAMSGRETGASAGREPLYEKVKMDGLIIDRTAADVLIALSATVDREVEPAPGEPVVVIRRAETDETLRIAFGQKERITISPTYGRGGSALVLDLTVTPMERPPRS